MIEAKDFWWVAILGAIGTFSIRFSFIAFASRLKISDSVREFFTFIPAAVLPALVMPMAFYHQGSIEALLYKERFFVLLLAGLVSFFSRSMLLTIAFGLGSLYLLGLL